MSINGCIAMVLAGGRGERLGALTRYYSKPAIYFGGKRRIIDYTLDNCRNSGINTVGVLSQYYSNDLHAYIAQERVSANSGIVMLPSGNGEDSYRGTADAIYKNIAFIEQYNPDCVLVLAGDHIYDMDYRDMITYHWNSGADVTVACKPVQISEALRYGIVHADGSGKIRFFEEKPLYPRSNLASMGIYVFKWRTLKRYLLMSAGEHKRYDFGKDILPEMLNAGEKLLMYWFNGYWRDIGTVDSLWEAHMEQIDNTSTFVSRNDLHTGGMPYRIGSGMLFRQNIVSEGVSVFGRVEHSVLGDFVTVDKGAEIIDSVIMPGAYIGPNVRVHKSIIGTKAVIMDNALIGAESGTDFFVDHQLCGKNVSLVSPWLTIPKGMSFKPGSHIYEERLRERLAPADGMSKPATRPSHSHQSRQRDTNTRKGMPV